MRIISMMMEQLFALADDDDHGDDDDDEDDDDDDHDDRVNQITNLGSRKPEAHKQTFLCSGP